jgi:glycosyltransferase involved in cell wall biosynthesis
MKTKQILIISPEPWKWQHVSKHHYAITLAQRGYKVYFLNPPKALESIKIIETNFENLYEIETPQVFKGLRFLPKVLRVYLESKWLKKLEEKIGSKFDAIWLFENSRFYNMQFAKNKLKIYHQVDSSQNFHIKEAASSADICFCVTDYIKRDLLPYNKKVFKISHGINFSKQELFLSKEQLERFTKNSINVAYIGNLDMVYINEQILHSLVLSYPNITFHFVGSYSENGALYKLCKDIENVIWWGRVDSALIPSILEKVDVTLLLYRVEEYREQLANSHKILEYLHSGKVTVATFTDEYKDKRELLEMVNNSNDYIEKFKEVVENLEVYNAKEKRQERIEFAKSHSYDNQLNKILSLSNKYTSKGL